MSGTRAISTTSGLELSSFFHPQGNAPKEIYDILTETLACFLPGRAKDLSASLYSNRSLYNPVKNPGETDDGWDVKL